jgi:AcrR family transcriptional regulator
LREAKRAMTRRRLLDAAEAEFAVHGYVGSTVAGIVAAAGATRPTFYLHFGAKAALVLELVAARAAAAEALWAALVPAVADGSRAALGGWLEEAAAAWEAAGVREAVIREAAPLEPAVRHALAAARAAGVAAVVAGLEQAGRFTPAARSARAELVVGQLEHELERRARGAPEEHAEALAVMAAMWATALGPPE